MHTGEPLFGGADQADQMCRIGTSASQPYSPSVFISTRLPHLSTSRSVCLLSLPLYLFLLCVALMGNGMKSLSCPSLSLTLSPSHSLTLCPSLSLSLSLSLTLSGCVGYASCCPVGELSGQDERTGTLFRYTVWYPSLHVAVYSSKLPSSLHSQIQTHFNFLMSLSLSLPLPPPPLLSHSLHLLSVTFHLISSHLNHHISLTCHSSHLFITILLCCYSSLSALKRALWQIHPVTVT